MALSFIPFAFPGAPGVRCAFQTRDWGVSEGPYGGGNIAYTVGDDPLRVSANRLDLAASLELAEIAELDQIHGDTLVFDPPASPLERFVEPPRTGRLPYSLLYHQTMATLASTGELSPADLARRVLTLSPFHRVTTDDYRTLLRHLVETDQIERTETGGLIVGLAGERVTNDFRFYATFAEDEEYTVRSESQELGTIVQPPPVGERIAIAGAVWVIEEIDYKRHLIECTQVKGKVPAYFGMCAGDVNTRVLERMRGVLQETRDYPYLRTNARARLAQARHVASLTHLASEPLVCLGGTSWCLLPWLGSYAFLALERFLKIRCADKLGLKGLDSSRPYFMQFTMSADARTFYRVVKEEAVRPLDPMELVYPGEVPRFDKYDGFVPDELVRKGFAHGVLDVEGMLARVLSWPDVPGYDIPALPCTNLSGI